MRPAALLALLLCSLLCALLGCRTNAPQVRGGGGQVTLGGANGTPVATIAQPNNPAGNSSLEIVRRERTEFAPPSAQAATGEVAASPLVRTVEETARQNVGGTQSVASIIKATGVGRDGVLAGLLAVVLGFAAWRAWKAEWPIVAFVLGITAILTVAVPSFWIGVGGLVAGALMYLAFRFGLMSMPAALRAS